MQEKSDRTQKFLDSFESLSVRCGWKTAEACRRIGISRSLFYELRDGAREVTSKMESRLEQAELEAGIGVESPNRTHVTDLEDPLQADDRLERVQAKLDQVESELARLTAAVEALVKRTSSSSDRGREAGREKSA